jgi:uncharacterized membrane protein
MDETQIPLGDIDTDEFIEEWETEMRNPAARRVEALLDEWRRGDANVSETERWVSMIGGGALVLYGLSKRSIAGIVLAAAGGALVYRGKTGHCPVYEKLGVSTVTGEELELEQTITINRTPEEVYGFYHNFENLPRFMQHLESVTITGPGRSHWVVSAPAGKKIEWDAEIVEEREPELIRWRTLEGADIEHHGEVRFNKAPGDRGTEMHVMWSYRPPIGAVGAVFARLAHVVTVPKLRDDLRRFKQILEPGEAPTDASARAEKLGGAEPLDEDGWVTEDPAFPKEV